MLGGARRWVNSLTFGSPEGHSFGIAMLAAERRLDAHVALTDCNGPNDRTEQSSERLAEPAAEVLSHED